MRLISVSRLLCICLLFSCLSRLTLRTEAQTSTPTPSYTPYLYLTESNITPTALYQPTEPSVLPTGDGSANCPEELVSEDEASSTYIQRCRACLDFDPDGFSDTGYDIPVIDLPTNTRVPTLTDTPLPTLTPLPTNTPEGTPFYTNTPITYTPTPSPTSTLTPTASPYPTGYYEWEWKVTPGVPPYVKQVAGNHGQVVGSEWRAQTDGTTYRMYGWQDLPAWNRGTTTPTPYSIVGVHAEAYSAGGSDPSNWYTNNWSWRLLSWVNGSQTPLQGFPFYSCTLASCAWSGWKTFDIWFPISHAGWRLGFYNASDADLRMRNITVYGVGPNPFLSPTPTNTPELTWTPYPTDTATPEGLIPSATPPYAWDCSNPESFQPSAANSGLVADPVVEFDPSLTIARTECYTIIPPLPQAVMDLIGLTGTTETHLCITFYELPHISVLGIVIGSDLLMIIPLAWLMRRLLTF